MTDVEALLRDTLQARGDEVTTPPAWDLSRSAGASRPSRRPLLLMATASAAVIAVIALVSTGLGTPNPSTSHPAPAGSAQRAELVGDVTAPPVGIQSVSSLGLQILVPADWSINDTGCGQTSRPSVARGGLIALTCWTPEPFDKTIAVIGTADLDWVPAQEPYVVAGAPTAAPPPVMIMEATTIDGKAAERGLYELVHGRTAGLLRIPSADVAVAVRGTDPETVDAILDSAHLVSVDNVGCPTGRPDALAFMARTQSDPLADLPAAVNASLCMYPTTYGSRLAASLVIDGDRMDRVVDGLARLSFDATVDSGTCLEERVEPEETLIIAARLPDGERRYVVLAEQGCDTIAIAASHDSPATVPYELHHLLFGELLHSIP